MNRFLYTLYSESIYREERYWEKVDRDYEHWVAQCCLEGID